MVSIAAKSQKTNKAASKVTWKAAWENQDVVVEDIVLAAILLLIAMFFVGVINLEYLSQIHPPHY